MTMKKIKNESYKNLAMKRMARKRIEDHTILYVSWNWKRNDISGKREGHIVEVTKIDRTEVVKILSSYIRSIWTNHEVTTRNWIKNSDKELTVMEYLPPIGDTTYWDNYDPKSYSIDRIGFRFKNNLIKEKVLKDARRMAFMVGVKGVNIDPTTFGY